MVCLNLQMEPATSLMVKTNERKIGGFGDNLTKLTDGLNKSVDGLEKISNGLMGAGDYLDELKNAPDQDMAGWFIPKDVLKIKHSSKCSIPICRMTAK